MAEPAPPASAGAGSQAGDLIELIAPYGTDEANHGTERYRVDNNGLIRVPREAAFHLIRAGFKPVPAAPDLPLFSPAPADPPKAETRRVPRSTR
jgi:hypothetical protein